MTIRCSTNETAFTRVEVQIAVKKFSELADIIEPAKNSSFLLCRERLADFSRSQVSLIFKFR